MPEELRATFDRVADLYQRARPAYPPQVFDDLIALSGVPDGGRVLEIGCGTGQATRPMAELGYRITAVELGENLARVARADLAEFPKVDVQVSAFEDWSAPAEPFDLAFAASSFHWLDASVALPKIAGGLCEGAAFAIIQGGHVAGGTEQFFIDSQECYMAHMPGTPPGIRLSAADDLPLASHALEASPLFEQPAFRRYVWLRDFTTATYIDELNTYSGHIALSEENRAALLACIANLIDTRYGGRITKAYMTDLAVARLASADSASANGR